MIDERPYGAEDPTSGWSGSDTSEARARRADADGTTAHRQTVTVGHLRRYGDVGLTWKELAALAGWHHGQASGVLSVLHKTGHVARLTERRDRCKVYVHPDFVNGRQIEPQGRSGPADPPPAPAYHCDRCGSDGHDTTVHDRGPVPAAVLVPTRLTSVLDEWLRRDRFGRCAADKAPHTFVETVKAAYNGDPPPTYGDTLFPT